MTGIDLEGGSLRPSGTCGVNFDRVVLTADEDCDPGQPGHACKS